MADRAAGIRADGDLARARCGRDARAGGGATGNAGFIRRIAGGAVMRIDANAGKGKFTHIGPADDHSTRLTQAADNGRIGLRRCRCLQDFRGRRGHFPRDIEQILDRDDAAIQRAKGNALLAAGISRIGG